MHADFVSGHIALQRSFPDVPIIYGPESLVQFDVTVAQDGTIFELGNVRLQILHTPGHTIESISILLLDSKNQEKAVFTGDTLMLGDVGRIDLAVKGDNLTLEVLG